MFIPIRTPIFISPSTTNFAPQDITIIVTKALNNRILDWIRLTLSNLSWVCLYKLSFKFFHWERSFFPTPKILIISLELNAFLIKSSLSDWVLFMFKSLEEA